MGKVSAEYRRAWYKANPDKIRAAQQRYREKYRGRILLSERLYSIKSRAAYKESAINMCSNGNACCVWCGQADIDILCLDHVNDNGAEHRKQIGYRAAGQAIYQWVRKHDYPDGFQALCANCNLKKEILRKRKVQYA